jgi:hypothetical protein
MAALPAPTVVIPGVRSLKFKKAAVQAAFALARYFLAKIIHAPRVMGDINHDIRGSLPIFFCCLC